MTRDEVAPEYMAAGVEALKSFPLDVTEIKFVGESENITFRVSVNGDASDYALRLHRPGYNSIEELKSERLWIRELQLQGINVPDPVETSTGEGNFYSLVEIPSLQECRYAGVTKWLKGSTLCDHLEQSADPDIRAEAFEAIGVLAARMHDQSQAWTPPPDFERRRLDGDALLGDTPHWGRFWQHPGLSDDERTLLRRSRDFARQALESYGQHADRFGLIHSDMNTDNIIYHDGELSLIDFDDAAFGWYMYDLASALIEYIPAADFAKLKAALLKGYQSQRALTGDDFGLLELLLFVRGMVTIGWFQRHPEETASEEFQSLRDWVISEAQDRMRLTQAD